MSKNKMNTLINRMLLALPEFCDGHRFQSLATEVQALEAKLVASRGALSDERSICHDLNKQVYEAKVVNTKNNSKLQHVLQDISSLQAVLEVYQNEESSMREGFVAERRKQQSLDALAGRLENHALNAEDRLQKFIELKQHNKQNMHFWEGAELARICSTEAMGGAHTAQTRELTTLQREIETASVEASAGGKELEEMQNAVKAAQIQLQGESKKLRNFSGEVETMRRRVTAALQAAANHKGLLESLQADELAVTGEVRDAEKRLAEANSHCESAEKIEKILNGALQEAERAASLACRDAETAEKAAARAEQYRQEQRIEVHEAELSLEKMEMKEKNIQKEAQDVALAAALALQRQLQTGGAVLEAKKTAYDAGRHEADLNVLLNQQKARLASLDVTIEQLSRSRARTDIAGSKLSSKRQQLQQEMDELKIQAAGILRSREETKIVLRHHQKDLSKLERQENSARQILEDARSIHGEGSCVHTDDSTALGDLEIAVEETRKSLDDKSMEYKSIEKELYRVIEERVFLEHEVEKIAAQGKTARHAVEQSKREARAASDARISAQLAATRALMRKEQSKARLLREFKETVEADDRYGQAARDTSSHIAALDTTLKSLCRDVLRDNRLRNADVGVQEENLGPLSVREHELTSESTITKHQVTERDRVQGGEPHLKHHRDVQEACARLKSHVDELEASLRAAERDCTILQEALHQQRAVNARCKGTAK